MDISPVPPHPDDPANVEYVCGDIKKLAGAGGAGDGDDALGQAEGKGEGGGGEKPFFAAGTIDYIFQRHLILGMTDWPGYIRQMARLLKPGGYIELHELAMI